MNRSSTDYTPLDGKFHFVATNPVTGKSYTEEDGLVLLAKDNAVPTTLRFYREECERQGAALGQLEAVDSLIERVDRYRLNHPELCKVADVTQEEIAAMRGEAIQPGPTESEDSQTMTPEGSVPEPEKDEPLVDEPGATTPGPADDQVDGEPESRQPKPESAKA